MIFSVGVCMCITSGSPVAVTTKRKRLDRTGKTHFRTMSGAKVADVTVSLKALGETMIVS